MLVLVSAGRVPAALQCGIDRVGAGPELRGVLDPEVLACYEPAEPGDLVDHHWMLVRSTHLGKLSKDREQSRDHHGIRCPVACRLVDGQAPQ